MTAPERTWGLAGAGLALGGSFVPWAQAQTPAGVQSVSGFDHGGGVALACALLAALLLFAGRRLPAAVCAAVAAGWTAVAMYQLPGTVIDEAFKQSMRSGADGVVTSASHVEMTFAASAVLMGALVLLVVSARGLSVRRPGLLQYGR